MKKITKNLLCIIISAILVFSSATVAFSARSASEDADYCPTIIIPGLFQSEIHLYDNNGKIAKNMFGQEYKGPFFLDPTISIVIKVLGNVVLPLANVILRHSDAEGKFAASFAKTLGSILLEKVKSDQNGKLVYNIDAVHYNCSFAECSPEDQAHILSCIPMTTYLDIAGEDNMYFFSYVSFGNIDDITAQLYDYIQFVKNEKGCDKVNIVPISQGGSLFNNLLEYYPEVTNDFNRIIYVVPALDGSSLISDIYRNGILDDDDALYGYMMPELLGDELTGSLINLILRLFPKAVLNDTLDKAVDELIESYLKNSTCLWAFVSQDDYEICRDKYLSGDENAVIRKQTDAYHKAQVNSKANILKAIENGVEVFDIVNYNYALYPIVDSWNTKNADGIIQLSSTSMGAYSGAVDEELPAGYVQQGNSYGTCSDPENHNHIDPHNLVDASTALLPDHTFYYYNGDHESTGSDDALIALVVKLLTDETFTDIYSYPDDFPQFNTARNTKRLRNDVNTAEEMLASQEIASAKDAEELIAAINEVNTMLSHTNVDLDETAKASERFYNIYYKIKGVKTEQKESLVNKALAKIIGKAADRADEKYGYNGYWD